MASVAGATRQRRSARTEGFAFEVEARDGRARAGRLHYAARRGGDAVLHAGGHQGDGQGGGASRAARARRPDRPRQHLSPLLPPRHRDRAPRTAGCTASCSWDGPILTDSGGFQVFSLAGTRVMRDDGVEFSSVYDGSRHVFTPELAMRVQEELGADIIMAFDQCAPGTLAARGARGRRGAHHALGGGLQGGSRPPRPAPHRHRPGRRPTRSCGGGRPPRSSASASTPTPSAASASASAATRCWPRSSSWTSCCRRTGCATSWASATRVGIVDVIARGVDVFDCVLPTRMARTGTAILRGGGRLNLRNARFAADLAPLEDGCDCYTLPTFTRSYLRHLVTQKEMLGAQLLSLHNLRVLLRLTERRPLRHPRRAFCRVRQRRCGARHPAGG